MLARPNVRGSPKMNYERIYREFIADRRKREPALSGYTERHHILPRSLGGTDDAGNLITLTAEDHYFAHCCLAKIHGAGMWTALCRMRWGRVHGERLWIRGRPLYGLARKRHAENLSRRFKGQPGKRGDDNARYDGERLDWTNLDTGEKASATKWEMWDRFGGCRAHWTSASHGARKSMKGWTTRPEAARIRGHKGKVFQFVNRDGRRFSGTQNEFVKAAGLNPASACRVVRYRSVTLCGWRLEGVMDRPANFGKDGLPSRKSRSRAVNASALSSSDTSKSQKELLLVSR